MSSIVPYFGLSFIGFASFKAKGLPEAGGMNFFLLYASLPALLFGIMTASELNVGGQADRRDVVHPDRSAGAPLGSAARGRLLRQEGANPSRIASRRNGANAPIR